MSDVRVLAYDASQDVLVIETVQVFHLFFSLLRPAPSRLVTTLTLRRENGLHYVALQEDFYHPDHFLNLLIPPLAPIIRLVLYLTTLLCVVAIWFEPILGLFPLRGPGKVISAFDAAIRRRGLRNTNKDNVMGMTGHIGELQNGLSRVSATRKENDQT
ncbi:hypothetical protein PUNSTDRAFT_54206 [Punctularia strigosozonata HHB-11173 SS5]|uniref:uncharacterized protein n=1 Tax=Punctularia strigosozonata (strain HHB-11173) TaxID=741275 RepID=UPI000441749D|nr:uncharacterized protein PUNSTDRAFT_54206 [Punctularia strigosozonata HHB-11173 SS5]EIN06841.1 hypothetical protein PUNSTDRAFT_54206 [Punctularia strigosozonata HHB-11173 SS5]